MDNGFRKFKRKIRFSAIVRAMLMGVSLGTAAFAALWLVAKLTNTAPAFDPNFLQYGIIGGGIALVCSVVFILLMLPTDKRLAKRLDNKLELHEKVQTMVAFRKEDSEMIRLQRQTTQELLMQTPTKKARNKSAWLSLILPVVACACMAAAIVVPAQGVQSGGPKEDPSGWYLSDYDKQKLLDLIQYVETSGMQEEPKADIVAELNDLLTDLQAIKKKVAMEERVVNSIAAIHEIAEPCHTHTKVVGALKASLVTDVASLGDKLSALESSTVKNYMEQLRQRLTGETEDSEELVEVNKEELAGTLAADLQTALAASGEAEDHPLQKALADFAAELAGITNDATPLQVQELLNRHEGTITAAIKQPGIDVGVEKYTINRLMTIFGISADKIPQDILDTFGSGEISGESQEPGQSDSDKTNITGGVGRGDNQYASDDVVYDITTGAWVPYGDVLDQYENIILEYMLDGDIPADLKAMVDAYLATLHRPVEE